MHWPEQRPAVLFDEDGQRYSVLSARESHAELWSGVSRAIEDLMKKPETAEMSLEQSGYALDPGKDNCRTQTVDFVWKNHYQLENFMHMLQREREHLEDERWGNLWLELSLDNINYLEKLVENDALPRPEDGFYDETGPMNYYKDLAFCRAARRALERGFRVIYRSR